MLWWLICGPYRIGRYTLVSPCRCALSKGHSAWPGFESTRSIDDGQQRTEAPPNHLSLPARDVNTGGLHSPTMRSKTMTQQILLSLNRLLCFYTAGPSAVLSTFLAASTSLELGVLVASLLTRSQDSLNLLPLHFYFLNEDLWLIGTNRASRSGLLQMGYWTQSRISMLNKYSDLGGQKNLMKLTTV